MLRSSCSARPEERQRKGFADERVDREPPQIVPKNHPCKSGVTKDILFLDFEHVVYGRSDVVRCLDEQPRINLRWYGALFYRLSTADGMTSDTYGV